MDAAKRALAALEDLEPRDQLAGIGWAVVAVLGALRERFAKTPEERDAFDALIARLESGNHDPTLGTLQQLAKALKVTVGELVD